VCNVNRGCFLPPPRVDSAVVRLDPRPSPLGEVADPQAYLALVRACFQRRRKTLVNALAGVATREQAQRWVAQLGLDPNIRPERLGPAEFAALQRAREAEPSSADADASADADTAADADVD
jgi:16S rRNA (adenine1518-N6/adenine1519-N6)-dimethyltransferase